MQDMKKKSAAQEESNMSSAFLGHGPGLWTKNQGHPTLLCPGCRSLCMHRCGRTYTTDSEASGHMDVLNVPLINIHTGGSVIVIL